MTNRLLTKVGLRRVMQEAVSEFARSRRDCTQCQNPMFKGIHTCIEKIKKKEPEDLTKLTDDVLKQRIFYSDDPRGGESSGPLIDELWRRYDNKKKECDEIYQELVISYQASSPT